MMLLTTLGLALAAPVRVDGDRIGNGLVAIAWSAADHSVSATWGGHVVHAASPPGTVTEVTWTDPVFGAGKALEVAHADGSRQRYGVFPDLPVVLVRSTLQSAAETTVAQHEPGALSFESAVPPAQLKALGTAGLTAVDGHPGSYVSLVVADPESRAGLVTGWLTHDRGDGVVRSHLAGQTVVVEPRLDYGGLRLPAGQPVETETLVVGWYDDARAGLEQLGDMIARQYHVKLPAPLSGYCTWYSSPNGGAADQKSIVELGNSATALSPYGFDFVQIDDGWQLGLGKNGPRKVFGGVRPDGPYAAGMKPTADKLKAQGHRAGIWFMPFAGEHDDPFWADKQGWFATGPDGKPFDTAWGGTSIDMSVPAARDYLRAEVQRIVHDWGYRYLKMDGLYTGIASRQVYVNSGLVDDHLGEAKLHDPDVTHIQAFRTGLTLIRETAGPETFLLGCCVPQNMRSFGGSLGLLDAMRIGADNGSDWANLMTGPGAGTNRWWLNGRVWWNDPDPVYVRPSVPLNQARLIASWVAVAGQLTVFSEWLPSLPPERVEILKRIFPNHGLKARPVDVLEQPLARVWLLSDTRTQPRRDVVAVYNWDAAKSTTIELPFARLGLPEKAYSAFDFWSSRFLRPATDKLVLDVPPASCRMIALRPVTNHPVVLSTSRHVTQGMVELSGETWDATRHTLSGTSRLVGGDPYELRLLVPSGEHSWKVDRVSTTDAATQVKFEQDGPQVRVSLARARSGPVAWQVTYVPAAIVQSAPQPPTEAKVEADALAVTVMWAGTGRAWQVTLPTGESVETGEPRYVLDHFTRGATLKFQVRTLGWDGTLSTPAEVVVQTEAMVPPPAPPTPDVPLSSLKWVSATTGWGAATVDNSVEGNPLTLAGKVYPQGLGVHAAADVVYAVPEAMQRFVAVVGLDDEKKDDPRASVVFELYAGDKLLAKSPLLCDRTLRTWAFNVTLPAGTPQLRLHVGDGGDGIACDHADWVAAGFCRQ